MPHPKDHEVYPIGTVVRLKRTGEFARITDHGFQHGGRGFLNYIGIIEGRGDGRYALYHDDLELEALPPTDGNTSAS
jgi:hypothetical protein